MKRKSGGFSSGKENDMKNFELLGVYQGVNIHVISLFDFIMLDEDEQRTDEHMWMISEDNRLIYKGMIIGQVNKNRDNVTNYATPTSYTMFYGKYLRAKKEKEHKVVEQPKVITERATVEALFTQGEKKLIALIRDSEESLIKYESDGAKRLSQLVKEGTEKAKKYKV